MLGLLCGILLIIVGASLGLRQSRNSGGALSLEWRSNELPKHEHEQAKRS